MKEKRTKSMLALLLTILLVASSISALGVSAMSTMSVDGLVYEIYSDYVTITDYTGTATELEIPDEINGKTVAYIDDYAFSSCSSLTSVTIPDTIIETGIGVFNNCENLEYVTINCNIDDIKDKMFKNCKSLKEIYLEYDPFRINEEAFYGCESLEKFDISCMYIGMNAFNGCTSLSDISLEMFGAEIIEKDAFLNTGYYNDLSNWEDGTLYIDAALIASNSEGDYIVKDGTETIADYAFYGCDNLDSIVIPDTVINLGKCAFKDCTNLKKAELPQYVSDIPSGLFKNCENLAEVNLPYYTKSIKSNSFENTKIYNDKSNWDGDLLYIDQALIAVNDLITGDCIVKDGIEVIANYAFKNCKDLESISVPDTVISIGDGAFYGCDSLKDLYIHTNEYCFQPDASYFPGTATIYGYEGSAVQALASLYKRDFVSLGTSDGFVPESGVNGLYTDLQVGGKVKYIVTFADDYDYWTIGSVEANIKYDASKLKLLTIDGDEAFPAYKNCNGYGNGSGAIYNPDIPGDIYFVYSALNQWIKANYNESFVELEFEVLDTGYTTIDLYSSLNVDFEEVCVYSGIYDTDEPAEPNTGGVIIEYPDDEPTDTTDVPDYSEPIVYDIGDVNRDEKINIKDATYIQKYCAKMADMDSEQAVLADFNLDSKINVKDATTIQKFIAGLI